MHEHGLNRFACADVHPFALPGATEWLKGRLESIEPKPKPKRKR
jgi:hypothetical protein